MFAKSFGRRGSAGQTLALPSVHRDVIDDSDRLIDLIEGQSLLAAIPILTAALVIFLLLAFGLESKLAFDIGRGGEVSLESIRALGGVSYDLVIGEGQWWRVFLAPCLHANDMHLLGNCFAAFMVGAKLEPIVGRRWYSAIFVGSALLGVEGSLLSNPHHVVTLGASGAISGLIGALFVVSFQRRGDPHAEMALRRSALVWGLPAVVPFFLHLQQKPSSRTLH